MNDDLVGIGGLLGRIVLLVLYALAIGAKTKQQPSKPLKSIQLDQSEKHRRREQIIRRARDRFARKITRRSPSHLVPLGQALEKLHANID